MKPEAKPAAPQASAIETLQFSNARPWSILAEVHCELASNLIARILGRQAAPGRWTSPPEARVAPGRATAGNVAILPLHGVITPRAMWGGASLDTFRARLRGAVADPGVSAIALDVFSPGGVVYGLTETAAELRAAREAKPLIAVVGEMAASAAYWLAANASEIVVAPSADVGSIGVWQMHVDISKALEDEGVKVSIIKAGKYKIEDHPFAPLAEEARAHMQGEVDAAHEAFIADVAKGRGATQKAVREGFGEGRMVGAQQALKLGMADSVGTLEQVVARLQAKAAAAARSSASSSDKPAADRFASTFAD